jgi:two-component system copper resistance phosphate regulon response regulator CusR
MGCMKAEILLVEDEPNLGNAIASGLRAEDWSVTLLPSAEEALFLLSARKFDLLVLDIMLPGRSGLELLEAYRKAGNAGPVLLLTAKDRVEDKVQGFETGADDYLVKPFAFAELLARVKALLKRVKTETPLSLQTKNLKIDLLSREVKLAGKTLDLTVREFEILEYLTRHRREVVSREMLAKDVWRETSRITPLDNVIDVHMARLRKKLELAGNVSLIQTVRGVGFVLKDED